MPQLLTPGTSGQAQGPAGSRVLCRAGGEWQAGQLTRGRGCRRLAISGYDATVINAFVAKKRDGRRLLVTGVPGVVYGTPDGGPGSGTWLPPSEGGDPVRIDAPWNPWDGRPVTVAAAAVLMAMTMGCTAEPVVEPVWNEVNPGPGNSIQLFQVSGSEILSGGLLGKLSRSTDGGQSWTSVKTFAEYGYVYLGGPRTDGKYLAGCLSRIYASTDRVSWDEISHFDPTWESIVESTIAVRGNVCMFASTTNLGRSLHGIWKSTDGGVNWSVLTGPWGSKTSHTHVWQGNGVWFVCSEAGVKDNWFSVDDGATWTAITTLPHDLYDVIHVSGDVFCAVVSDGCYRSVDGGATWTAVVSVQVQTALAKDSHGWVYCFGRSLVMPTFAVVRRSKDNGATWEDPVSLGVYLYPSGSGSYGRGGGAVGSGDGWMLVRLDDGMTDGKHLYRGHN